jgi:Trk-type K+ transport system membrane component
MRRFFGVLSTEILDAYFREHSQKFSMPMDFVIIYHDGGRKPYALAIFFSRVVRILLKPPTAETHEIRFKFFTHFECLQNLSIQRNANTSADRLPSQNDHETG